MLIDDEKFMQAVDLLIGVSVHSKTCLYYATRPDRCCRCMEDTATDALKLLGVLNVAALKQEAVESYEKQQKRTA